MPLTLTPRQQVLFDRLVTLGQWASEGELPIDVVEITGFGSFFRGKASPRDVDLIVRHERQNPPADFQRFLRLLNRIDHDLEFSREYDRPVDALLQALEFENADRLPGLIDHQGERRRFAAWLDGFSWNMLLPQTIHGQLALEGPELYAKRMVKRQLPNLNVVYFVDSSDTAPRPLGLRCGFTVSIWSKDRPNTRQNLEALLSNEAILANTGRELSYFDAQLPKVRANVELLKAEVDLLFRTPRRRKRAEFAWKWFEQWLEQQQELQEPKAVFDDMAAKASAFDEQEWDRQRTPEEYKGLTRQQLVRLADAKRGELKKGYYLIDTLEDLRGCLVHYKSGTASTKEPAEKYVVSELLSRGSAAKRKRTAAILKELGLGLPKTEPR